MFISYGIRKLIDNPSCYNRKLILYICNLLFTFVPDLILNFNLGIKSIKQYALNILQVTLEICCSYYEQLFKKTN